MPRRIKLDHPGTLLKEDFLDDMGIKPATLAKAIGVDRAAISKIIAGERDITPDMSMRLGLFFKQSPRFWLGLQTDYNARMAERENMAALRKMVIPYTAITEGTWTSV